MNKQTEESTIFLKRKSSFQGILQALPVYMNGNKIGSIKNGKQMELKPPLGRHQIYIKIMGSKSDVVEINLTGRETVDLTCGIRVGFFRPTLFLYPESDEYSAVTIISPEKPSWAPTVAVISIIAGILGLIVLGIPLGATALLCGTSAANAGEGKGKIGMVLGIIDMVGVIFIRAIQ